MGFLFSGVFWGIIIILVGVSVIVKVVFHVDIPVIRLVFAFVLIYMGVRLLCGGFGCRLKEHPAVCGHTRVTADGLPEEHNVVFGTSDVDATGPVIPEQNKTLRINTIFGSSQVRISSAIPTVVKIKTVFGSAVTPDGNNIAFGEYVYKNKAQGPAEAVRRIELHVVFGSAAVVEQ